MAVRPRRTRTRAQVASEEEASQAETSEAGISAADPPYEAEVQGQELEDIQGQNKEPGPSQAPAKRKVTRRKRGPSKRRKKGITQAIEGDEEEDNVLIIENGERIQIPPKHGTPVQHTRPKRKSDRPSMTINVNARSMAVGPGEGLPSAPVQVEDSFSVSDLKDAIYAACPFLPPIAQRLFYKDESDEFQELDGSGLNSLKDLGMALPGPHEVWLQAELERCYPAVVNAQGVQGGNQPLLPPALSPAQHRSPNAAPGSQPAALSPTPQLTDLAIAPHVEPQGTDGKHESRQNAGTPLAGGYPAHHRSEQGNARERKKNKRWSNEEVENLLLGLMKFGLSAWTTICTHWQFEGRTTVDLKDKWRNLVKNVRDGRQMRGMTLTEEAKARIWRIMRDNRMITDNDLSQPIHRTHPNPLPTEEVS